MRLVISPLAERDLEDIGDFIASDNPARALSFVEELRVQCHRIGVNPVGYRQRPELGADIRSCPYGRYIIVFTFIHDEVRVVRILHGARDILSLLSQDT